MRVFNAATQVVFQGIFQGNVMKRLRTSKPVRFSIASVITGMSMVVVPAFAHPGHAHAGGAHHGYATSIAAAGAVLSVLVLVTLALYKYRAKSKVL